MDHVWPHQKAVVRFGLRDVTKPAQFFEARVILDPLRKSGGAQVHPADDTGDKRVLVCKTEQKRRLGFRLIGLYSDGRVNLVPAELWQQVFGKIVSPQ